MGKHCTSLFECRSNRVLSPPLCSRRFPWFMAANKAEPCICPLPTALSRAGKIERCDCECESVREEEMEERERRRTTQDGRLNVKKGRTHPLPSHTAVSHPSLSFIPFFRFHPSPTVHLTSSFHSSFLIVQRHRFSASVSFLLHVCCVTRSQRPI